MRALAAAGLLVLASAPARAGDAGACAAMRDGTVPELPCTRIGRVAMKGGAIAELYEVSVESELARWTIVIDDHGKVTRSPTLELVRSNCGSQKCELGDARAPRLRRIRGGAAVVIELWTRFDFEVQTPAESGRYETIEWWHDYDAVECSADTCVTRHRSGRRDVQ